MIGNETYATEDVRQETYTGEDFSGASRLPTGRIGCTKDGVTFELLKFGRGIGNPAAIELSSGVHVMRFRFTNKSNEDIEALRVIVYSEHAAICEITDCRPPQYFEQILEYEDSFLGLWRKRKPWTSIRHVPSKIFAGEKEEGVIVVKLKNLEGINITEVAGIPEVKFMQPTLTLDARYKFAGDDTERHLTFSTTPITIVTPESVLSKIKKEVKENAAGVVVGVIIGWLASNFKELLHALSIIIK